MRGGESFTRQVHNPVTDLAVTRRIKDAPFTVKDMADRKGGVAAVAMMREF